MKGLLAGLVAAGLVGCSGLASTNPTGVNEPGPTGSVALQMSAEARTAATDFYAVYSAGRFAASWDLLTPTAKRQIPKALWVKVHDGCPSTGAGMTRVIKAVTLFGNSAIITETISGTLSKLGTVGDVFSYTDGRWGYLPQDLSIYHHRSVAADIAAAKASGYCGGKKVSPL